MDMDIKSEFKREERDYRKSREMRESHIRE